MEVKIQEVKFWKKLFFFLQNTDYVLVKYFLAKMLCNISLVGLPYQ